MPRYIIERTFPEGLNMPADGSGAQAGLTVVGCNSLPVDQISQVRVLDPYFNH